VYGLGCDPLNISAVNRLIDVKGNRKKPFPILASSIEDVKKIAIVSAVGEKIAKHFWPGPLTIVFPKKTTISNIVTFGRNSVGVRMPRNQIVLQLMKLSNSLLIGSSANKTGIDPPQNLKEISSDLIEMVDIVLDGEINTQGIPSTVIDFTSDKIKILREGPIKIEKIIEVLNLSDK
jgi:L-threonylcarbamoyladenylate synthase